MTVQLSEVMNFLGTLLWAAATCIFAIGGSIVGCITGAVLGQTKETGFLRGGMVGIVSGAIVAIELLDSSLDGHFMSKIALFGSLVDGKVFVDWVCPAMLKAYQWQITGIDEIGNFDVSDVYNFIDGGVKGLSDDLIKKLPVFQIHESENMDQWRTIRCPICLQKFKEGDTAKKATDCVHFYHQTCIDEWLLRRSSCPVCRKDCVEVNE